MSLPITFNGGGYLFKVRLRFTELMNALGGVASRSVGISATKTTKTTKATKATKITKARLKFGSASRASIADLEYQRTKKILEASMEKNSVWLKMEDSSDSAGDQRHAAVVRPRSSSRTETKVQRPHRYKVLLLNDDFTPMDFVIDVLQKFFNMSHKQASEVMLQVHHEGMGLCGVFSFEVAETKAVQVLESARKQQHPLQCRLQRE